MSNRSFERTQASMDNIYRTKFSMNKRHLTTFNVGDLIPFHVQEVLPGDEFKINTSVVARLTTPLKPTMDNLNIDTYYFFVPNRILQTNWVNVMGESKGAWYDGVEYQVAGFYCDYTDLDPELLSGSIWDYFGLPVSNGDDIQLLNHLGHVFINTLPFRAYKKIFNDWFRDQNLQDPFLENMSDDGEFDIFDDDGAFLMPVKANKYHDYFTSVLPAPQKGPSVYIPFETIKLPVVPLEDITPHVDSNEHTMVQDVVGNWVHGALLGTGEGSALANVGIAQNDVTPLNFANLWATSEFGGAEFGAPTINALRLAFQIQRIYEKDARGGSRYVELIRSHFGVISPDARQQRPEFISGGRTQVGMQQVSQTAPTETSIVGDVGAFSYTADSLSLGRYAATEHGFIIGLMVARYKHTYSQGIERFWSRRTRFDFYSPELAHLGEQPVMLRELYAYNEKTPDVDLNATEVFGYQEAWADYRYRPNMTTGYMRPYINKGLGLWHYGDDYDTRPFLSAEWIKEDTANVDRTLAVPSSTAPNIICDIFIQQEATRPMPLYSVPGLIDHF